MAIVIRQSKNYIGESELSSLFFYSRSVSLRSCFAQVLQTLQSKRTGQQQGSDLLCKTKLWLNILTISLTDISTSLQFRVYRNICSGSRSEDCHS